MTKDASYINNPLWYKRVPVIVYEKANNNIGATLLPVLKRKPIRGMGYDFFSLRDNPFY